MNSGSAFGDNPFLANKAGAFGGAASTTPAFGTAAFGQAGFGSSSNNSNVGAGPSAAFGSAFGKPTFGSVPSRATTFGNLSNNTGGSAFSGNNVTSTQFNTNTSNGANPFLSKPNQLPSSGSSSFGQSATASAFGQPAFGQAPFSGAQSNLNANTTSSVFGKPVFSSNSSFQTNPMSNAGTSAAPPFGTNPNSAFGSINSGTSSPFASLSNGANSGNTTNASPFAKLQSTNISNFGTSSNSANSSPFASVQQAPLSQNASAFGKTATPAMSPSNFISNAFQTSATPFGHKPSPFGQVGNTGSAFAAPGSTSLFMSGISQTAGANSTASITYNTNFSQGLPPPEDESIKIEDIPEEALKEFKSDMFKLGHVPDIPPPAALRA